MLEVFLYLVIVEIIFFICIAYIRTKNQWFIIAKDKSPVFTQKTLKKILEKSYDSLLGWDRKPNTSGIEKNENRVVEWNINDVGARDNLQYNGKGSLISVFGDSFTFAREVNDNETWGYKLSCLSNSNVENFGVGNYGFDQALIKLNHKLESKKYRPEIVVIGVVPDTLSRILSIWKHYYEYGNIFGFKPRYILKDNKIELINNYINNKEKFDKIDKYLEQIQKNDFFYKNKFLKEIIQFPYTINFFRNFKRNFILSYETILNGSIIKPTPYIMKRNLECRVGLYKDIENVNLFVEELKLFEMLSKKHKFKPYFLMMPQKDDINYIKNNNNYFYKELIENVPSAIEVIDTYLHFEKFNERDLNLLYSENSDYGGHFSSYGNNLIAKIVYNKINSRSSNEKSL